MFSMLKPAHWMESPTLAQAQGPGRVTIQERTRSAS
ncbi:hypothetical protein STIAU_5757 [Stigmatella aurantiaca DW4/3-1]|uniref:Uncharacterized protein n=1 Tax=Stigmatella aurantiaca (strain DW4/3-1) TaxID=378806 RepID=Q094P9_STIAD|nr:hypothetical protein STIAU_5757 [Stigmatella aurantiaca DW4/3-1]